MIVARENLPETNSRRLDASEKYATTLVALGEIEDAREIQREVLAIREASLEPNDPAVLRARVNLALIRYEFSDYEGARDLLQTVVTAREQSLSGGDVKLLRTRSHLAVMHEKMGHLVRARMRDFGGQTIWHRRRVRPVYGSWVHRAPAPLTKTRRRAVLAALCGTRGVMESVMVRICARRGDPSAVPL